MSQDSTNSDLFDVVFFGILLPGKDKDTALANLAKLFKTEPTKLTSLFAGGRKVIKGKVTQETAEKYLSALTNVGLVVKLEECVAETTPEKPATESDVSTSMESQQTDGTDGLTMAEVGADVLEHPPEKEIQEIDDFSFLTMAEVGADVLEHPVKVKPQEIADFSDIELEEPS